MTDELLQHERDQYAAAIRELLLTVRHTAHHWSQTQPETMRRDDVVRALYRFAGMPRSMPEGLRDDLWQRIVGAYYLRFEHDGHPEDSKAAADEAMAIVQPELDRLEAEVRELRAAVARAQEYAEPRCAECSEEPTAYCGKTNESGARCIFIAQHRRPCEFVSGS